MNAVKLKEITIDSLILPVFEEKKIQVDVLRLDKIHPLISGNKWFKLRYYLEDAEKLGKKTILTFGGPWSNHLLACAAACNEKKFKSIGLIRGEKPEELSRTLQMSLELGMELIYISREEYKTKIIPHYLTEDDNIYIIPEGGYGIPGMMGAASIMELVDQRYQFICCAAGTGTMAAGLLNSCQENSKLVVISVLKNHLDLQEKIRQLSAEPFKPLDIIEYSFGGYAKYSPELINFMNDLYEQNSIPSDFVYTGKLFYAIHDLAQKNYFPQETNVLVIHSGGLQGNASLDNGTLIF